MHQRIRMSQIIQKPIAQPLPHMRARNQTRNIKQLNRNGAFAVDAGSVVGFTFVRDVVARAGAFDLEVAYGALGVYCCETMYMGLGCGSFRRTLGL